MKLTFLTFLSAFLHVSAAVHAQKVTVNVSQASLEQVLTDLRKQTGFDVFYNSRAIQQARPVTVAFNQADLETVLKQVFAGQPFTFTIDNQSIVVKEKSESITVNLSANSQQRANAVLIRVLDHEGNPIPGATINFVMKPGSDVKLNPVLTREDGSFILIREGNMLSVASLRVTALGSQAKTVPFPVTGSALNIELLQDVGEIGEVVVTGIFRKPVESFTGSATTVTAEELKSFGTRNLITSLRNIDPSFNIIESNAFGSDPNRMPEIQIRGNSSIPNVQDLQNETRVELNTPLIILDGFESSVAKLLDINENDVASITILKDASATAMYGSRGANGVIVINTKMPRLGKLRVSFGSMLNIENPDLTGYTLLKSRDKLELERLAGYYDNARAESDFRLKEYYNFILNEVNRGVETDWMSIPLRTSTGQRHNLRLEGGADRFRYSASAQYNNVAGVMKGSDRNTFNGGISLAYNFDDIRFRNDIQIKQGKSYMSPYGNFSDYTRLNPYWAPYDAEGNVNKVLGDSGDLSWSGLYWNTLPTNPLYNATLHTYDNSKAEELVNNTSVEWNIIRELIVRAQLGLTKSTTQLDRFRPSEHTAFANYGVDDLFRKGDYLYSILNGFRYDGSINLGYSKTFNGLHTVFGGADFNVRQQESLSYDFLAEGFPNARLDFIGMALQYAEGGAPSGSESFVRTVGFTGNANYIYNNKYFVDFVYRTDGSSQFGSKKRFAPFWSFGLGWNLHEEGFLRENSYINRLKIRASTGLTGSQNFGAYQALTAYQYYTGNRYYNWTGAYLRGIGNDMLKWQQTYKDNIGIDAEFMDRMLKLRIDVYNEITRDLISSVNLPASNGFSFYTDNIGKMRNRGFEAMLTAVIVNNPRAFSWTVTGSVLSNQNKVLETSQALKEAQQIIKNGTADPGVMYVDGYSSRTIWVVPSLGIDPSTGKELYLDINGEPTYTWSGNDVVAMGSTEPRFFGNFSTMLRYKDLSINAVFRYSLGAQQYNSTLVNKVEASNYRYNMDERVFNDRWKQAGDNTAFKGLLVTTPTYKSSRFVQDERTLVLSNINLQYDMRSKPWMKNLGLEALNITGNISEPLYLSSIRRERGTSYPFSRQFSLGFNATF